VIRNLELAGVVILLNLPLGYLRAGVRKFSVRWFVAVHAAIPLIALLRYLMAVGWRFGTLPLFVGAYAAGQFLGGEYRDWRKQREQRG
jgi:hypothetical protein